MQIERWTGPPVDTHTYLLTDEDAGEAWVVDAPLETAAEVLDYVRSRDLRLTRLILTHGHFDHILDAARYAEAGVPIAVHPADRPLLTAPQTALFGLPYEMPRFDVAHELAEGETLRLGRNDWTVWHVPGHAPGHVLLYHAEMGTVISGDLLFQGGYGRVDLPGCDARVMADSLRRLLTLPPETRVYPGHGPDTTLADERPWLEPLLASGRL